MAYETLLFDVADRIATITVNRPDKLNALNATVIRELGEAINDVRRRPDIGGAILTGAGRAFVAGADISGFAERTPVTAAELARVGQEIFYRYEGCPKPIVAAVNGFAMGGGCELAMACHVRLASETAKFGQPEVKLGLLPGYGGTQRLTHLVGKGRAMQMLLTGETIDATEAARIGLVNNVVPANELIDAARTLLKAMLANAPLALAACIEAVNAAWEVGVREGQQLEAAHFGVLAATSDMREGTAAFLAKRPAVFTGT